ncbi:hypothetical protein BJ684DRAFT_15315 [Piptocephalis cylindrospora]|uniref:Uncharacterized protein n=1 Tax=Piptocephalis cylindrospora TaxID=1907219 RepID=A0A4P9Y7U2_9FUNG|nr:hypothetical protein BJ684DRAFT_15315 [Piptocephalis cylindrospora]|eukprot:RKP14351.1 hypothetical protein BJ684DRAFT_15315 [Piptocephalis cylindrospora]
MGKTTPMGRDYRERGGGEEGKRVPEIRSKALVLPLLPLLSGLSSGFKGIERKRIIRGVGGCACQDKEFRDNIYNQTSVWGMKRRKQPCRERRTNDQSHPLSSGRMGRVGGDGKDASASARAESWKKSILECSHDPGIVRDGLVWIWKVIAQKRIRILVVCVHGPMQVGGWREEEERGE